MILQNISRILNNKYFVGFCIVGSVIAFALFQLLNTQLKYDIAIWMQHPLILLPTVVIIVFLSNFNVCLAIILLVFMLAVIIPINQINLFTNTSPTPSKITKEAFESGSTAAEMDAKERESNTQYYVDGIKNLVTGRIRKIEEEQNNAMNKGILENKKKILEHEKSKNSKKSKSQQNNSSNRMHDNYDSNDDDDDSNTISSDKIIKKRLFNPNKEEDTNLLITKEILLDMINRIEYNYENNTYLRKYIKSRVEEIIDTNDLLDDEL